MKDLIQCPMCGYRYEIGEGQICQNCPLNKGCGLVCCPACGYQTVEAGNSRLASLAQSWLTRRRFRRRSRRRRFCLTLLDVPPGCQARVTGFLDGFPADRRAYLQAYGLTPDDWVTVLQNSPVTVIRLEHTEIALESELAGGIRVKEIKKEEMNEDCQ